MPRRSTSLEILMSIGCTRLARMRSDITGICITLLPVTRAGSYTSGSSCFLSCILLGWTTWLESPCTANQQKRDRGLFWLRMPGRSPCVSPGTGTIGTGGLSTRTKSFITSSLNLLDFVLHLHTSPSADHSRAQSDFMMALEMPASRSTNPRSRAASREFLNRVVPPSCADERDRSSGLATNDRP